MRSPPEFMDDSTTVRLQRCLDRLHDGDEQASEDLLACELTGLPN